MNNTSLIIIVLSLTIGISRWYALSAQVYATDKAPEPESREAAFVANYIRNVRDYTIKKNVNGIIAELISCQRGMTQAQSLDCLTNKFVTEMKSMGLQEAEDEFREIPKESMVKYLNDNAEKVINQLFQVLNVFISRVKFDTGVVINRDIIELFIKDNKEALVIGEELSEFKQTFFERLRLWVDDWHTDEEYARDMNGMESCEEGTDGCEYTTHINGVFYGGDAIQYMADYNGKQVPATYYPKKQAVEGECPTFQEKSFPDGGCYPQCPKPLKRISSATCAGYMYSKDGEKLDALIRKMKFSAEHGFLWRTEIDHLLEKTRK